MYIISPFRLYGYLPPDLFLSHYYCVITVKVLDGDDGKTLKGEVNGVAARDIVQFVEFKKHKGNIKSLAKECLEEIPSQFIEYFTSRGIKPSGSTPGLPSVTGGVPGLPKAV